MPRKTNAQVKRSKPPRRNGQANPDRTPHHATRARRVRSSTGLLPGISSAIGTAIGGYLGGGPGAALGGTAGSWFGRVTGLGAYDVKQNSLVTSSGAPIFMDRGQNGDVTICHREYIQDIVGNTSFSLEDFDINPGLSRTFPWLSTVATNFQQYQFEGLLFHYRPTCGTAVGSTNTALGTMVMATQYDVSAPLFSTKQQMESSQYCTSGVPYLDQTHPIECAPRETTLEVMYVRDESQTGIVDPRFYDLGKFQYATVGMQAQNTIGELWVTYKVKLLKPRITNALGFRCMHLVNTDAETATQAAPFGTGNGWRVAEGSSILPPDLGSLRQTAFTLERAGTYLMCVSWSNASTITAAGSFSLGANINQLNIWNAGAAGPSVNSGATRGVLCAVLEVVTTGITGNLVTFVGPTGMTSGNVDLFLCQISSAITEPPFQAWERLPADTPAHSRVPSAASAAAASSSRGLSRYFR